MLPDNWWKKVDKIPSHILDHDKQALHAATDTAYDKYGRPYDYIKLGEPPEGYRPKVVMLTEFDPVRLETVEANPDDEVV